MSRQQNINKNFINMNGITVSKNGENPTQYYYKHYVPLDVEYVGASIVSIINLIQQGMTPAETIECFWMCINDLINLNPDQKIANICVTDNGILINFGNK